MLKSRSFSTIIILVIILASASMFLEYCRPSDKKSAELPVSNAEASYVGDKTCQSCHAKEYSLWQQSDHFKAMEPATDSTVLGNFDHAVFTEDGVTSKFFRKEGKYYINTEGPDGKQHDYEVLYTFGFKPLQQYLVAFPKGRMQVPRVSWDVNAKKWFNQYAGQKIFHHDWLHWTGGGQNWNTMCASCHSTNLEKNYFPDADSFHTTYSVINVSCESCHGPASLHIGYIESGDYKKGHKVRYSMLKPMDSTNIAQINTCAPCHARKANIAAKSLNSGQLLDDLIPEIPTTEFFHADGQVDDEDYIYTSFLQSKMFHRSVKCSNCHDPHSGKKLFPLNQLCLQCHAPKYDSFEHHRHSIVTGQITCASCHMPGKLYMGVDLRHDHSFRVPRPDLSVKYGTPNACNDCHKDKPAAWASDAVVKWYGPQRKYHFSEDLIPGSNVNKEAEQHLARLIGDTSIPAIVKATAADYLRNMPGQSSLNLLLSCLGETDPQIRYRALRSLASFPYPQWKDAAGPLLKDNVRAVRIAAADLFLQIPPENIPQAFSNAFSAAKQELENYVLYQADFPVGNVMIADYYLKQQNIFNAEKYYVRGLKMDSMMNYARLNLSSIYNQQGKNNEALKILQEALLQDKSNERIYYNLALLYAELKDNKNAESCFSKTVALGSRDPRLFYNFGIFQQQSGKPGEAEHLFNKGLEINPKDPDLNYALAYLYMQMRQPQKALVPATVLKKIDPDNPNYKELFRQLQLN